MNRILFISSFRVDKLLTDGVAKKINTEINTFKNLGYKVDFLEFNNGKLFLNKNNDREYLIDEKNKFYHTMDILYKGLIKQDSILNNYDIVYLRYEHFSFSMLKFFKELKKRNKKIKIIGELPTYMSKPNPSTSLPRKISFYIKRFLNNNTRKDIDYLATFSDHNKLFGIPTIKIENFINFENIPLRNPLKNDVLDILALANITSAHGFDRVIEGLRIYYTNLNYERKVFLHIVGDGDVRKDLVELVKKYNLNDYVKFYGILGGENLNNIFNISDIGIGSLACFRKGATKVSELKIREYTARGLPFIYSAIEPQIENKKFAKKVSFDNTPIDIVDLINFYDSLDSSCESIKHMNDFAKKEFSCKSQMLKIINKIT